MHSEPELEKWCTVSNIVTSGRVVQALPIKLHLTNRIYRAIALVRTTTIQFALLEENTVVDSFEAQVFSRVLGATVVPTQHAQSDLLCLLTDSLEYFIIRVVDNRSVEVVARRKLERHAPTVDSKHFVGTDYIFNVRDTEGYIFFAVGATITTVGFAEKIDGLHLSTTNTNMLQLDEVVHVGVISQIHSKYRSQTLGFIVESEGRTSFRMASGTSLRLLETPVIQKQGLRHFYSGKELVLLTGREVFLYSYQSTKPLMTHRLPLLECAQQILFLEEVYCLVGESLLLCNCQGIKDYGEINGEQACHLGSNRIVVWHLDEDTRLLELDDEMPREIHRWLNLSQIFSVECLNDCGLETYVAVSPNRRNQLTLLRKTLRTEPLGSTELDEPAISLFRVEEDHHSYLVVGLADETTLISKISPTGLEEVWRIDMKLVHAAGSFVAFASGVYQLNYSHRKMGLLHQEKIERAVIYGDTITYSTLTSLNTLHILKQQRLGAVALAAPLSALAFEAQNICYAEWSQRSVHLRIDQKENVLEVGFQPRSIELFGEYLFVGGEGGKVVLFDIRNRPVIQQIFCCGTSPTRFARLANSVYCMSSSVIAVTIDNKKAHKETIALRNVNYVQQLLTSDVLVVSCLNELTVYRVHKSSQLNSHSIRVSDNDEVPQVRVYGGKIHAFKSKELLVIDPYKYEQQSYPYELEQIVCVEVCEKGILASASIANGKYLSYFRDSKEVIRQVLKRQPSLLKWMPNGRVVVGYENDLKLVVLDEENLKLTDLASIELSVTCAFLSVNCRYNKLLVADPFKSLLLIEYQLDSKASEKSTVVATTACPDLCNDVAFLNDLAVAVDKNGGLMTMLPWLDAANDLEKMALYVVGSVNINEEVWTLTEEQGKSVLFGTAEGGIGRLRNIDKLTFQLLQKVEIITADHLPFLTEDYFKRIPKVQRTETQTNVKNFNGMIDCRLLKTFLETQNAESLLKQNDIEFSQVTDAIEQLSRQWENSNSTD